MNADFINVFRKKIIRDKDNRKFRRDFHENYEWLESYWRGKFSTLEKFCKKYGKYFWSLKNIQDLAKKLAFTRCMGNSKDSSYKPTEEIMKATMYLRKKFESETLANNVIDYSQIECKFYELCRIRCNENYANQWEDTNYASFKALMYIIRQIRNNLFHGNKLQIENEQYNRNKKLVQVATLITNVILDNLKKAELNEQVHN